MVGDTFLIWDGLGVGGGGGGGQLPKKKKILHKEKAPKNILQSYSRKRHREQINGNNCIAQKNFNSRKGQRTNQKYRNLVGSDQQMQRLA